MPAYGGRGGVGVAGAQGVQDLGVLGEGQLHPVGVRVQQGHAHPQLAVAELVVEPGQDLVAGVADDLGVEAPVGGHQRGQVPRGGVPALFLDQFREPLQQGGGRGHGPADGELLDQQPRFDDVGDLLCGDRQHQGALLRVQLQEALGLQPQQRLADGRAGDADGLGELPFREQHPALVAAVQDALLDVAVDAVGGGRGGGRGRGGGMRTG